MFSAAQASIFAAMGRPATYTPPAGSAVPLRVVRVGGGQQFNYGSVVVYLERVRFEVLRSDLPSPVVGSTLEADGTTWTIDAVQPVFRDAYGLKWGLDVSWGAAVTWRSVIGAGATQNPPSIIDPVTVAADAAAGESIISIKSSYAVGVLVAGDVLTIAGASHAVTTATVTASSNVFSAIGISPALAADVALGDAASLTFSRDVAIKAAVSGYTARELQGGISSGDVRLVLLPSAVSALPETPKIGDLVAVPGVGTLRVVNIAPVYAGATIAAYEVQARK